MIFLKKDEINDKRVDCAEDYLVDSLNYFLTTEILSLKMMRLFDIIVDGQDYIISHDDAIQLLGHIELKIGVSNENNVEPFRSKGCHAN